MAQDLLHKTTFDNKVKLGGVVKWSESKLVTIGDGQALVHRYLVQNTITTKNNKQVRATFTATRFLAADAHDRLFQKDDQVLITGTLGINYRPMKDKKGNVIKEKGKDDKEYDKTYKDVEIRIETISEDLPF